MSNSAAGVTSLEVLDAPEGRFPGERVTSYDVAARRDTDYYAAFDDIPDEDRAIWDRAKRLIDEVAPTMREAWDRAEYPLAVVRRIGELDLLCDGIEHPDITYFSPLAAGLVNMEISRGDGSLGTVLTVQGGLALRTLALFGSPEQQDRWLRPLAAAEVLGAFAMTERSRSRRPRDATPTRGSGSSGAPRSGSATALPEGSRSSGLVWTIRMLRSTVPCAASWSNRTPPATRAA